MKSFKKIILSLSVSMIFSLDSAKSMMPSQCDNYESSQKVLKFAKSIPNLVATIPDCDSAFPITVVDGGYLIKDPGGHGIDSVRPFFLSGEIGQFWRSGQADEALEVCLNQGGNAPSPEQWEAIHRAMLASIGGDIPQDSRTEETLKTIGAGWGWGTNDRFWTSARVFDMRDKKIHFRENRDFGAGEFSRIYVELDTSFPFFRAEWGLWADDGGRVELALSDPVSIRCAFPLTRP